jgi:hypothetical protein
MFAGRAMLRAPLSSVFRQCRDDGQSPQRAGKDNANQHPEYDPHDRPDHVTAPATSETCDMIVRQAQREMIKKPTKRNHRAAGMSAEKGWLNQTESCSGIAQNPMYGE